MFEIELIRHPFLNFPSTILFVKEKLHQTCILKNLNSEVEASLVTCNFTIVDISD